MAALKAWALGYSESPKGGPCILSVHVRSIFINFPGDLSSGLLGRLGHLGPTKECLKATWTAIQFVQSLGFLVHFTNSRLTPASTFEWIGLRWNLLSHTLSLPKSKCEPVAKATSQFLSQPQSTRRAQERVLGFLQFASITDPMLKVRLKDVERVWRRRANCRLRDKRSLLPPILKRDSVLGRRP